MCVRVSRATAATALLPRLAPGMDDATGTAVHPRWAPRDEDTAVDAVQVKSARGTPVAIAA